MDELPPSPTTARSSERQSASSKQSRPRQPVSTACRACREKRTKCDGPPPPCEACLHRQRECVFNVDTDQRRRLARKHKADEAEFHQRLLYGLLRTIRTSEEPQVQDLLNVIQRGSSLDDIMEIIEKQLDQAQLDGSAGADSTAQLRDLHQRAQTMQRTASPSRASQSTASSQGNPMLRRHRTFQTTNSSAGYDAPSGETTHRKVMAIDQLVDTRPLCNVPYSPWTNVTESNHLVSHLMSFYFTWWDPFFRVVDQDTFIGAMQMRGLDTPFCSPFLVNAMLSIACQVCDFPRVFMSNEDLTTRGVAFHDEAVRLWNEQHGEASLTNLQGLCLLMCSYNLRGNDKAGWGHLGAVIEMYNNLSLSESPPSPNTNDPETAHAMEHSLKLAAWAAFSLTTEFSLVVLRPAYLDPPVLGLPFTEDSLGEDRGWAPYPETGSQPLQLDRLTNELCELLRLCQEIPPLLFDETGTLRHDLSIDDVDNPAQEMKDWQSNLPANLQPSSKCPPVVFEIHMFYYNILITLFGFLISSDSLQSHDGDPDAGLTSRATAFVSETLPLFRLFRQQYGLDQPPPYLSQVAVAGANALLMDLDDEDQRAMFAELVDIMINGGRRIGLWQGAVLMLRETASELHTTLPIDVNQRLKDFEDEFWPSCEAETRDRFNSIYPNYAFAKDPSRKNGGFQMGDLLNRWTALRFDGNRTSDGNGDDMEE